MQAVPEPALPDQARAPRSRRPARAEEASDGAKAKGKAPKLCAGPTCSMLPFLHTLELHIRGEPYYAIDMCFLVKATVPPNQGPAVSQKEWTAASCLSVCQKTVAMSES